MGFLTDKFKIGASTVTQKITGTLRPTVGYSKPAPQNASKVASLFHVANVNGVMKSGGKPKL